jgi:hypothetical protein
LLGQRLARPHRKSTGAGIYEQDKPNKAGLKKMVENRLRAL